MADRAVHLNIGSDRPQSVESLHHSDQSMAGGWKCNFQNSATIYLGVLLTLHTILVSVIVAFGARAVDRFL